MTEDVGVMDSIAGTSAHLTGPMLRVRRMFLRRDAEFAA
jgi:hypothetical protein